MHRVKRVIVCDFDELIMSDKHSHLSDVVVDIENHFAKYFNTSDMPVNWIFYNNFFLFDLPPFNDLPPYFRFLRYRMRAPVVHGSGAKSMFDPQACLVARDHFCGPSTPGFRNRGGGTRINEEFAVSRHYRICVWENLIGCLGHKNLDCPGIIAKSRRDDTILRYRDELVPRVAEKIRLIAGHDLPLNSKLRK